MDPYNPERCRQVTQAAEEMLRVLNGYPSKILDGLSDRPRPSAKQVARETYVEMLRQIHEFRTVVEMTRPVRIVLGEADGPAEGRS